MEVFNACVSLDAFEIKRNIFEQLSKPLNMEGI
jgi:hypothetical protein